PIFEVASQQKHQADGGRRNAIEGKYRMARTTCKKGARADALKPPDEAIRRAQSSPPQAQHAYRVARNAKRRKRVAEPCIGLTENRLDKRAVAIRVDPQLAGRLADATTQHDRRPVIERMSDRRRGPNPGEAVLLQGKTSKKGRQHAHGMNRRADVVDKARQC